MFGYIYLLTNEKNGKMYVGQHKYEGYSLDETYFCSCYNEHFLRALDKYGKILFHRKFFRGVKIMKN